MTMTGEIVVGKFVDRERPDYQTLMRAQYVDSLGRSLRGTTPMDLRTKETVCS